jgi:hypothetical protein
LENPVSSPFFPFHSRDEAVAAQSRIERDHAALEEARSVLIAAGYYAYGRLDDQNRYAISVDDETGRADVRIGDDGYEIELWVSSPGLYAEEESDWRRTTRARLARISIPRISRGLLEPHQHAYWDEVEEGVAVSEIVELPFVRTPHLGDFIREHLPHLEDLVTQIESRIG